MKRIALSLGLAALSLGAPLAAAPKVVGPEFRVSSASTNAPSIQRHPIAAYDKTGGSLVVWEDDKAGLVGRFFAADGTARGAALTLVGNQRPATLPYAANVSIEKEPAIAFLPSGQFLLFWTEESAFEQADLFFIQDTLTDHDVFGQLFSASGQAVGSRFQVHGSSAGFQSGARALVRNQDVVVAWTSSRNPVFPTNGATDGVFARAFAFSGAPKGGEFRVSPAGTRSNAPALASGSNGKFLIAFESGDGSGRGIFAQPYTAALAPIGSLVAVNTGTTLDQRRPAVAADSAGNYLVVWQSQFLDIKHTRIYAQQLGAAGNLIGAQIAVTHGSDKYEIAPSVAAGKSSFLVVWLGYGDTFPTGIQASSVNRATGAVGAAVQINQRPLGANTQSWVAGTGAGSFLTPWEGFVGDNLGISAQRLTE
jgi:hypothetical protein